MSKNSDSVIYKFPDDSFIDNDDYKKTNKKNGNKCSNFEKIDQANVCFAEEMTWITAFLD